ncbi:lantibiotic dehydratase [Gemella cuniculi]|uniref:lantibiotic dehydratase n=1 Tax=Gemella cuniculi TaxID=150240 RepID=UPI003CCB7C7C
MYTSELSIKYTNLINLLEKNLQNYASYSSIEEKIKEKYKNVTSIEIENLMLNLIENQIIYSNLKEDTYCNDNLAFILEVLKSIKYRGEKLTIIKKNNKINKSI